MKSISILCSDAVPQPKDFNLPDFTRQVFDMYDGTKEKVTLLCKNELMNYIVDKFGDDVETSPTDNSHFKAVVEVSASQTTSICLVMLFEKSTNFSAVHLIRRSSGN